MDFKAVIVRRLGRTVDFPGQADWGECIVFFHSPLPGLGNDLIFTQSVPWTGESSMEHAVRGLGRTVSFSLAGLGWVWLPVHIGPSEVAVRKIQSTKGNVHPVQSFPARPPLYVQGSHFLLDRTLL